MRTRNDKVKRVIMEMIVYACVVIGSASAIQNLSPKHTPTRITAEGSTDLIMIEVPVPVEPNMEGKKYSYHIDCQMHQGVVRCGL